MVTDRSWMLCREGRNIREGCKGSRITYRTVMLSAIARSAASTAFTCIVLPALFVAAALSGPGTFDDGAGAPTTGTVAVRLDVVVVTVVTVKIEVETKVTVTGLALLAEDSGVGGKLVTMTGVSVARAFTPDRAVFGVTIVVADSAAETNAFTSWPVMSPLMAL